MNDKKIISGHTETSPAILKDFFRTYYSERYKAVKIVTLVIAVILFIGAAALYYRGFGTIYTFICVWAGAVLIIYPRNMYRRPYKNMKDTRVTTYFDFYDGCMTERAGGNTETYKYSEIYKTMETPRYFYIFHSPENVSILEKKDIAFGSEDILRELLKAKTDYKRQK